MKQASNPNPRKASRATNPRMIAHVLRRFAVCRS
jgi:hypothetical protein